MKAAGRRSRGAVCPAIGVLMRYGNRVMRVRAEARGQRVMIESVDGEGRTFVSAVRWGKLAALTEQLFSDS